MRRTRCGEHGEDTVRAACALTVVHRAVCRCAGAFFGAMRTHEQSSVADMVWCDGMDDMILWCFLLLLSLCLLPLHFGLQGPHDRDRVQPGVHCDCVPPAHWQPPVRVILAAMQLPSRASASGSHTGARLYQSEKRTKKKRI